MARELDARAFTEAGIVHIPDEAGALDGHDAAPLLAHELTHAAQQQRYGSALPAHDTALGAELEAEASAVETWIAGGAATAPPHVRGHLDPTQLAAVESQGHRDWRAGAHELPTLDPTSIIREYERATGTRLPDTPGAFDVRDGSFDSVVGAFRQIMDDPPRQDGTLDDVVEAIATNPPRRWFDLDDLKDFDELANRLYNHLHSRLRFDVLVERERSGTLMDFG